MQRQFHLTYILMRLRRITEAAACAEGMEATFFFPILNNIAAKIKYQSFSHHARVH